MLPVAQPPANLDSALPGYLQERVRVLSTHRPVGEFVLVWMRTAVRAHHNPALDAALCAADHLDLPVFVYHALSERYPYASDRHHRFILEGARDVAGDLAERGIGTGFHLERPGHRGPHLKTLAARAALVVTEDLPVPPLTGWTRALRDSVDTPLWVVDTACILPMKGVHKAYDRAFAFRDKYRVERAIRLQRGWTDRPVHKPPFVPTDLPFEPVDLASADLSALIAACDIDHSVGPVPETRGGTAAGMARWEAFRDEGGLDRYASTRNAAQKDGTSRMSAYLHYGMVSPFELARDASTRQGRGPAKFLDELLIWRELAHAWCSHQPDLHRLDCLPEWAVQNLEQHRKDRRTMQPSWETLARGTTGDRLWDACQTSLLRHGELHNNVRMTWGKQLLQWTDGPEHARTLLVDLNHRYALDGRDPCSYGGLYWCLGLFDRPFSPAQPITGTVRGRDTSHHARRMPLARYLDRVRRPMHPRLPRVAVVGAGVAGLACARVLHDHGVPVTVLEQSGVAGGRLRPGAQLDLPLRVDPGLPCFRASTAAFRTRVHSWVHDGLVVPWSPRIATWSPEGARAVSSRAVRYVSVEDRTRLCDHLARGLDVETGAPVEGLMPYEGGTRVLGPDGRCYGHFEVVLFAVPGGVLDRLLPDGLDWEPCSEQRVFDLICAFSSPLAVPFDILHVPEGPMGWLVRESAKPGRRPAEVWRARWCPPAGTDPTSDVQSAVDQLRRYLSTSLPPIQNRVSPVLRTVGSVTSGDAARLWWEVGLGVCGEACVGEALDARVRSGEALAGRVLQRVADRPVARADPMLSLLAGPAGR